MPTTLECVTPNENRQANTLVQVIIVYRLEQDAAATTTISAFRIGFVNEKQHTATDWARLLNFHFHPFKDPSSIFKLYKHFNPL